jgi:hypothetical protein
MTTNSPILERRTAPSIIASICMLTALMQLVAGITIFNNASADGIVAAADNVMLMRIFLPLAIAIFLNLAASVTVYLMRCEAVAFMGCSLATLLAKMLGNPVQVASVTDLALLLALLYFTIRLFQRSAVSRAGAAASARNPFTMLLIGLTAGQVVVLLSNLEAYPTLVSTGAVSPLAALSTLVGCGALYAAVLVIRTRPARATKLFLFAALAMGISLPGWNYRYGASAPFWLGLAVALLGYVLAAYLRAESSSRQSET